MSIKIFQTTNGILFQCLLRQTTFSYLYNLFSIFQQTLFPSNYVDLLNIKDQGSWKWIGIFWYWNILRWHFTDCTGRWGNGISNFMTVKNIKSILYRNVQTMIFTSVYDMKSLWFVQFCFLLNKLAFSNTMIV